MKNVFDGAHAFDAYRFFVLLIIFVNGCGLRQIDRYAFSDHTFISIIGPSGGLALSSKRATISSSSTSSAIKAVMG